MKLLYAEDERAMSEAVADVLTYHKYDVDVVDNGRDALEYALAQHYDGVILDVMMPGMDGIAVLTALRSAGCRAPVLLLTAKSQLEDRIYGLDCGADDYLPKPFATEELLARIRAMLRRREAYTPDTITLGNITFDPRSGKLSSPVGSLSLSRLEFRLMERFMHNPGMTFSAEALLDRIWGCESTTDVGSVWVYISYLRKKLATLQANVEIRSRRNLGYSLEVSG